MTQENNKSVTLAIVIAVIACGIALAYWFLPTETENQTQPADVVVEETVVEPEPEEIIAPTVEPEPIPEPTPEPMEPVVEDVEEELPLPSLDASDDLVKSKMSELTWRKELLKLVIDEDMIRRFVVFTDNFANGTIVYEHSPLVTPSVEFMATELASEKWQWNKNSASRYNLYVELIQSFEAEQLVNWYFEFKPLIDQAYDELGYPDSDFTDTLRAAIERVLDMKLPEGDIALERPSVMFKFSDSALESLPEADKLLIRIGKSNLLVLKSLLLKIDEKLEQHAG